MGPRAPDAGCCHDVVPLRAVLTGRDQALALDNNDLKIFVAYRDRAVVRTVELGDQRDVSLRRRCLLLLNRRARGRSPRDSPAGPSA
jgi:hypothetical protein